MQFTRVLALYDPFGIDVPLNLDITHSRISRNKILGIENVVQYIKHHWKLFFLGGGGGGGGLFYVK